LYVNQSNTSIHELPWKTLVNVLFALTMLAGCNVMGNSTPSPTPPPTAPSVHSTTLNLGLPQKALSAPIIGTVPDSQMLHVNVTLKVDQATLDQLGANNNLQVGKAGSPPDLAKKLGISDENLKKIQAYFGVEHINVQPDKTRTNLTFDAQAGSVARLLQTKFVIHQLNGRKFFTPDPNQLPKIPTVIANYILAITGLDNYSLPPQPRLALAPQQLTLLPTHAQGDATCLNTLPRNVASEDRVAHAYGYDRFWNAGWHGENMTVNLVEIGGFDASATVNYWECVGSTITMDEIPMSIVPPPSPENTLDIEMLSGLAPNIHLNDYEMDQSMLRGTAADFWTAFNAARATGQAGSSG
jgi:kumamolisin